jgi:hypothetical protein
MNVPQQIFGIFFAVFFGILVASLSPRSFPTDKLFTCQWHRALLRLTLSIVFINLLPAIQFILMYWKFESYNMGDSNSLTSAVRLLVIPASAFGMFTFNRWYFAILKALGDIAFPHQDDPKASSATVLASEESGFRHFFGSIPYWFFLGLPWLVRPFSGN